jgi:trans-aconitate methyltransferase
LSKDNQFSPDLFQRLFYSKTNEKTVVAKLLRENFLDRKFNKALDIGAGPGEITNILAQHADALTIVEANTFYENTLRNKFPRANVIIGDVRTTELDSDFNFILLNQVLYFFPANEWLTICGNLRNKLSSGGELLIILNDHHCGDLRKIFASNFNRLKPHLTWDYMPLDQFASALTKGGATLSVVPYSYEVTYESLGETITALEAIYFGVSAS